MTLANPYHPGRTLFMGVELLIAPGALVPREETELLGRTALHVLQSQSLNAPPRLIDMCCGVGNLVCALATARKDLHAWASDLTDGAVRIARANVARLDLGERVTVVQGDLFAPLAGQGLEGTIDVIVCNPPYISTGKLAGPRADLLVHEPREAFDGGPYGVSIFQRVIRDGLAFLRPGGALLFEFGVGQAKQVRALFDRANGYVDVVAESDPAGEPRVVRAVKRDGSPQG